MTLLIHHCISGFNIVGTQITFLNASEIKIVRNTTDSPALYISAYTTPTCLLNPFKTFGEN